MIEITPQYILKIFKPEDVKLQLPNKGLEDAIVHYVATTKFNEDGLLVVHAMRFEKFRGLLPMYQTRAYVEGGSGEDISISRSRQIYRELKKLYQAHPAPNVVGMQQTF